MGLCNVKEVAQSDDPTENYHPILQLLSAVRAAFFLDYRFLSGKKGDFVIQI